MKITTRQLQIFDAVANHGSIRSAAAHLGMSQSAVSTGLSDLQIIMRKTLFLHIKGRSLHITDEGMKFRSTIRSIVSSIGDLEQVHTDKSLSGTIVIGATSLIAETILPHLCVKFMKIHSDTRIKIEVYSGEELFNRLARLDFETVISEYLPLFEGVELIRWRTDEMVLVVAPDHPLASRKRMTAKEIAGMPWCMRETKGAISARVRAMLHESVGQLDVVFEANNNWALRHAVRAGGGIGCLSKTLVKPDIETGRLVRLDVEDFKYIRPISLARPKDVWRSRLATVFDQFLMDHADQELGSL
jgi:DNA-binding transcriptional LysR family regulator